MLVMVMRGGPLVILVIITAAKEEVSGSGIKGDKVFIAQRWGWTVVLFVMTDKSQVKFYVTYVVEGEIYKKKCLKLPTKW